MRMKNPPLPGLSVRRLYDYKTRPRFPFCGATGTPGLFRSLTCSCFTAYPPFQKVDDSGRTFKSTPPFFFLSYTSFEYNCAAGCAGSQPPSGSGNKPGIKVTEETSDERARDGSDAREANT
jgi:hypothetical protein